MSASTSCNELAREVLAGCLARGGADPKLVRELVDQNCSSELFGTVVEGLADRFEPRLCDCYADLFSDALALAIPGIDARALRARYQRVRQRRRCRADPQRVVVLSRVTLGADIAITSILLDMTKVRFPRARIFLAGSAKAAELFAADNRIEHLPVEYPRAGSLRERLAPWQQLQDLLAGSRAIVIDPDSRLTQLGLLPVCAEEDYFFFESRAAGGDDDRLSDLTRVWARETFGATGEPYLAPRPVPLQGPRPRIAVSLGVGQNPAKRICGRFEAGLLEAIAGRAATAVIDRGAGGEEAARVEQAVRDARLNALKVHLADGSFAQFASLLAQCDGFVGYDSAGQHAAAAFAIPLVTVFAGFPSRRMLARWTPTGRGRIEVVVADSPDPEAVLAQTIDALKKL